MIDTSALSPMQMGRLNKALNRRYSFDRGVMTLRRWLETSDLTHKTHTIRRFALHKTQGSYNKLKTPKHEYTVWQGDSGLLVPKIVYDALTDLPERT